MSHDTQTEPSAVLPAFLTATTQDQALLFSASLDADLLSRYLGGVATPVEREVVEAAMDEDPAFRAEVTMLQQNSAVAATAGGLFTPEEQREIEGLSYPAPDSASERRHHELLPEGGRLFLDALDAVHNAPSSSLHELSAGVEVDWLSRYISANASPLEEEVVEAAMEIDPSFREEVQKLSESMIAGWATGAFFSPDERRAIKELERKGPLAEALAAPIPGAVVPRAAGLKTKVWALFPSHYLANAPQKRGIPLGRVGAALGTITASVCCVLWIMQLFQTRTLRQHITTIEAQLSQNKQELEQVEVKSRALAAQTQFASLEQQVTLLPDDQFPPPQILMGASSSDKTPVLLVKPVATTVIEQQPVLMWKAVPEAKSYLVTITEDQDGRLILVARDIQTTQLFLIPKALNRNSLYAWQVKARLKNAAEVKSAIAHFRVLDVKRAAQVTRAMSQVSIAAVRTFLRAGLIDEAQETLDSLPDFVKTDAATKTEVQRFRDQIKERRRGRGK